MDCNMCKYWDKGMEEYPCNKCIHNAVEHFAPLTNYERIKSMSIEKMASFLYNVIEGQILLPDEDIEEWLEREATE